MNKPPLIVVEGKSDTNRLKELDPNIMTFQTSGLGLDDDKLAQLKKLSQDYEIIVFTDPDGPGEKIRMKVSEHIAHVKHAYLPSHLAKSKDNHKVGVEHASVNDLKEALSHLQVVNPHPLDYSLNDLINWQICNNKKRRLEFCDRLNIAYGNNQKVVKQLNNFAISLDKIKQVLEEMESNV